MYQDFFEEDTKAKDNSEFSAEHKKMLADEEAELATLPTKVEDLQTQAPGQPGQPAQAEPQKPKDQSFPWEAGYDAGDAARNFAEVTLAAPTALVDFGTDVLNMIPGVDIPEIPEFKNEVVQGGRELASIILPNILVIGRLAGALKALPAAKNLAQGGKAAKLLSAAGEPLLAAGVGAGVDAISRTSEDHNFSGQLKEMFPPHMQWIPDWIGTSDADDSNTKRLKNVLEGIGLGIFGDLLIGASKIVGAFGRTRRFIPESEFANPFKELDQTPPTSVEEAVTRSADAREQVLDEHGALNAYIKNMDDDLDTPVFGAEDVFNPDESGVRSADPGGFWCRC